jgi:long-chain acyl-CoA synthetase
MSSITVDFDAIPTLGELPRYHAQRRGAKVALRCEDRTTSWAELDDRADRVAGALIAAGCAPGDRIAFVGKGSDRFFELLFGAARAGVVLVPVQWRLAAPEIAAIVADAGARMVFADAAHREALAEAPTPVAMEVEAFDAWRDAAPPAPLPLVTSGDVAIQLYTSGTTGLPKGVMLSHANLLAGRRAAAEADMEWNAWREDDVGLVAMPLGHIGGVGWALVSLLHGATTIIHREFAPAAVLDALSHGGVSKLFLVPTAIQMLLMSPDATTRDYSRLRHILYGASPIALDLLRQATAVFGCGFAQQYGMTETCGTIVYLPPEDHDPAGNDRMRSAGLPMPGVELRVVDPASRAPLPAGAVGEVETRSACNMVGYWRRDDATAETVSIDGWLRTGDAGYLDNDGYLFIHDRFKDMIVSGAENIYPAEVESAIFGHPAVADVAVIGVPDATWGEAVKAVVVLRADAAPDAESIIAWAKTRIAPFKAPKSIDFAPALPRNPAGKVLRRHLREPYWEGRERGVN